MSRWTLVLTVFLAACGKSEAVVAYEELATAVCKCVDEACARDVGAKFEPRLARFAKEGVQAKDAEAINKIAETITACAARLVASAPPPAAEGDKPSMKVKLGKPGDARPAEGKPGDARPAESAAKPAEGEKPAADPALAVPPPAGEPSAPATPPAPPSP